MDENKKVDNLQPFFDKNFHNPPQPTDTSPKERKPPTIGHLVKHLGCLTHLYPKMIEKNHAFGDFYTKMSERDHKGYKIVTREL